METLIKFRGRDFTPEQLMEIRDEIDSLLKSSTSKESLLKKREQKFYQECEPFIGMYGKKMVDKFFSYWSEPNKSNTKMRWEMEKTWEIKRRMRTWADRNGIRPVTNTITRGDDFAEFSRAFESRTK